MMYSIPKRCQYRRLNVSVFRHISIAPQIFKFVEMASFGVKNVHDSVKIIHQHPFGIIGAFLVERGGLYFVLYFFINAIRDGLYVCIRISLADDKKIGGCITQFAEV